MNLKNKDDLINLVIQFIKFGIVGVSNTLISLGIYYIFLWINESLYMWGYVVGFGISVLNAYFWNRKYVFKASGNNAFRAMLKTYVSYGFTFLLGLVLIKLMVDAMGIHKTIAPIINLLVTIPLNFVLNKFWAMAPGKPKEDDKI